MDHVQEYWQIRKAAVRGNNGLIATQHYRASEVGAEILRAGGNAVDAAVAAGLTLGTVEPWMSGIGGGGYMTVYLAKEERVQVVEFGMRAPFAASAEDYPIVGEETGTDTFNWPRVKGDANVHGPLSTAVPGYLKGVSLALETFGTMEWRDVIAPAVGSAEEGVPIDWYSTHMITGAARGLRLYEQTRQTYLHDGLPPTLGIGGTPGRLKLGQLAETYRVIQKEGQSALYGGEVGERLAADMEAAGSRIRHDDFAEYEARLGEPATTQYRRSSVYCAGHLTAGPTLMRSLNDLAERWAASGEVPDINAYSSYADTLLAAYEYRLKNLGEGSQTSRPTNTTHLCVSDRFGNVVSLTQTIMSGFGSRIMSPSTGILMNNGMMWFDPRPGGPNSVVGGRHPLCNMCPTIAKRADGAILALGACGGRHIFPAVFQLLSFLLDYKMDVDEAVHQARLDVSGTDVVTLMSSMDEIFKTALADRYPDSRIRPNGVSPMFFGLPQVIQQHPGGEGIGGCFIPSPHARVVAA